MSNNQITIRRNHWASERMFFFYAALVTVLFHLALLLLFKCEAKPEQKKTVDSTFVSMLCLNSSKPERNELLQDILEYGNPTLFTVPDEKYGYSSLVFRKKTVAYMQDLTSYTLLDDDEDFKPEDFRMFRDNLNENSYVPEFPSYAFILRNQKRKATVQIEYPMALSKFNKELPRFFSGMEQLKEKIKLLNPRTDTVIRIYESGTDIMPRIKLAESSGILELDQLALRTLLSKVDDKFRDKIKNGELNVIKIKWQKGKPENDIN